MKKTFLTTMSLLTYTCVAYSSLAHAWGGWDHHGDDQDGGRRSAVVSVAGPNPYHPTYAAISSTTVTIQNFDLRTEDGQVVHVATAPIAIDLQALQGPGQGILISLVNATFPTNSPDSIQVAEIVTQVVSPPSAQALSAGASCTLKMPKTLNLYTAAPITVHKDSVLVKVAFSPLASIEITSVTKSVQNGCDDDDRWRGDCDKDCSGAAAAQPPVQKCELVNRRQLITDIQGG